MQYHRRRLADKRDAETTSLYGLTEEGEEIERKMQVFESETPERLRTARGYER